ncbi:uncharacterized protein LOC127872712 isoform X2 [Dreissena polymorpha]|uniref:uncharacterized protein LOC127872712 isoform X2 n=1 Tax=Dreissena polymorpha TaxID=45954 RepID=UPI0022649AD6|nr:uncharacterized protein LOC127872712 isoform X2 [Dreissena polymorpha]
MDSLDSGVFPLTLLPRQPIRQAFPPGQGMVPEVRELIEKENRQPLIKKRKTGDEASDLRVAKKKNDNTSGGKGFGKRKRRFIYDTTLCRSRLVMISDEERKKHLWIKILMDLYTSFMQYMHILLLILYVFCCLFEGYILFILRLLQELLRQSLLEHMGLFQPRVSFYGEIGSVN